MGLDAINQNFLHKLIVTPLPYDIEAETSADSEPDTAITNSSTILAKTTAGVGTKFDSGNGAAISVEPGDVVTSSGETVKPKSLFKKMFDAVKKFFKNLFGKKTDDNTKMANDATTKSDAGVETKDAANTKNGTELDSQNKELDALNKKLDDIYCSIPSDKAYTDDDKAKIADIKAQITKVETKITELTPKKVIDIQTQYQNKLQELNEAAQKNEADLKNIDSQLSSISVTLNSDKSTDVDMATLKATLDSQNDKFNEKVKIQTKRQNLQLAKTNYDAVMQEYNTQKAYLTDQLESVNHSQKGSLLGQSRSSKLYKVNLQNQLAQVNAQIQDAEAQFREVLG